MDKMSDTAVAYVGWAIVGSLAVVGFWMCVGYAWSEPQRWVWNDEGKLVYYCYGAACLDGEQQP